MGAQVGLLFGVRRLAVYSSVDASERPQTRIDESAEGLLSRQASAKIKP